MLQYHNATKDKRVIDLMTRNFQYQLKELPVHKLDHWSRWEAQRGGDNLLVVYWLYNITGEKFLLDLLLQFRTQVYCSVASLVERGGDA